LTCSLRVESLHTLFAIAAVVTGTCNNQAPSIKSGIWWRADITPYIAYNMRIEHV